MTILCEPDAGAASHLASYLGDGVRIVVSLRAATRAVAADPAENLVVIGGGIRLDNALEFAGKLSREVAGPEVILLRDYVTAELISHALDCGVHAVLPATDCRALADAYRRALETRQSRSVVSAAQPAPVAPGRIVTVVAAKGGCGKTTLAINLALTLNANGTRRVCLLDLDLDSGDIARALHIEPGRTLADAAAGAGMLTRAAVSALVTPLGPALDCVLAPVGPGQAERVPPELVVDVLAALPGHYDYVVVDTAAQLPGHVLAALDAADHHVLVTVPEVPALQNLRETLDVLDMLGYPRDARSIVVNRTDPRVVLSPRDVEKLLRAPLAGHVPFSWDVAASVNRGVPITVEDPDHPVSKAIQQLGRTRIAEWRAGTRAAAPRRAVRGWST